MEHSPCIIPSLKYSNEGNNTVISSFIKKNNINAFNANAFTSERFPEMLKCEVYKMFSDVELELQPNAWIATFNIKSMLLIFNLGENNFHSLCRKKKNPVMMGFHSDRSGLCLRQPRLLWGSSLALCAWNYQNISNYHKSGPLHVLFPLLGMTCSDLVPIKLLLMFQGSGQVSLKQLPWWHQTYSLPHLSLVLTGFWVGMSHLLGCVVPRTRLGS